MKRIKISSLIFFKFTTKFIELRCIYFVIIYLLSIQMYFDADTNQMPYRKSMKVKSNNLFFLSFYTNNIPLKSFRPLTGVKLLNKVDNYTE